MTHIDVHITKGAKGDVVEIRRASGKATRFEFPKKGPIPHDAVHLFVEQVLGLKRGFWGMVSEGRDPSEIQEIAKAAGHASSTRARVPDADIVELLQAERLVECFEADLWGGPGDCDTFRSVAEAACGSSHIPMPVLSDERIGEVRLLISNFSRKWSAAPVGSKFEMRYDLV